MAILRATDQGGYSLLELIVALAIMSMLGAFAMPSLLKVADRTQFSLDRTDVERQLDQLPQSASALGRNLVLTSTMKEPGAEDGAAPPPASDPAPDGAPPPTAADKDPYPVTLPDGWNIIVDKPIYYRYDGSCSGGTLRLIAPEAEEKYLMKPPLCELRPG